MIASASLVVLHALLFLAGACLGSFLGVVIDRLSAEPLGTKGLCFPRSHCLDCNAPLAWFDLIPVLSYLLLRGRCRRCGARIPSRLLGLEVFCGLLALLTVARWGPSWCAVNLFALCWFLLALAWIDLRTGLLPLGLLMGLLLSGWGFGLVGLLEQQVPPVWVFGNPDFACVLNASLLDRLIGAVAAFAALAGVLLACTAWLRARGRITSGQTAMGWGDPLLLAGIGAHVGWSWLSGIVMLACTQGLLVALWSRSAAYFCRPDERNPVCHPDERSEEGSPRATRHGEILRCAQDDKKNAQDDSNDATMPQGAFPFGPFLASGTWMAIALELLWPGFWG